METASNLSKLDAALSREGEILAAAVAKSMSAYNQSPTQANLRDYQANKKAYQEYKALRDGGPPEVLASKTDVLRHLRAEGWAVKKSKLFADLKGVPRTNGGWKISDVEKYASLKLVHSEGAEAETNTAEKIRQEVRVAAARAEKLEMENDILRGRYILRAEAERLHATKAHMLKAGLEDFFRSQAASMVDISGGDPALVPDLREYCLRELFSHLHEYAKVCRYPSPELAEEEEIDDAE